MKKLFALLLAALMLLGLAACGAESAAEARSDFEFAPGEAISKNNYPDSLLDGAAVGRYEGSGSSYEKPAGEPAEGEFSQKLIRKLRLTVETEDYPAFIAAVTGKAAELGGYIEDMEANTSGSSPSAVIVVRVPAEQLSAFTDGVNELGNVTYKHESRQDVTLQYVDTESRISALRTEQDRLLALLERAEGLSEVLEIEDRLSDVRYELESYERSLRALANQVNYATATIEVRQVKAYTPTEEEGYWEKIGNGLKKSLTGLRDFLKELFSFLIVALPYLLVFVVLPLVIVLVLLRRRSRRKKAKPEAQQQPPRETPTEPK